MTTFTVDRQRFGIETDPRTGTPYVHSIHPYDETEYHWARISPAGMWKVYRRGKLITIFGKSLNLEPVFKKVILKMIYIMLKNTDSLIV